MNNEEIIAVSQNRWKDAQKWEGDLWIKNNTRNSYLKLFWKFIRAMQYPEMFLNYIKYNDFYCGDDWNYWWLKAFENFKVLPKNFERALEVGCGPYTNIRLISRISDIKEIHCADPLIDIYKIFKLTWLASQIKKNKVKAYNFMCEKIEAPDNFYDLVVCINVLDHVQDTALCLKEINRVTKKGGYIILGQDLSDKDSLANAKTRDDIGHPIKINHTTLERDLEVDFKFCLKKIIPKEQGRNPEAHYGTFIFIGSKVN